jgi:hypothetical protein
VPGLTLLPSGSTVFLTELFSTQPPRTSSRSGAQPSDLTNVGIVAEEEELRLAFAAAGWRRAEPLSLKSVAKTMLVVAHPHRYGAAPVSTLLLDAHRPDLVFEKQNDTIAKRHHIRLWKVPGMYRGRPVWIGAATHDVGIVFRLRSGGFSHRVYSQIDDERAKIELDLASAGWVDTVTLIDHPKMPAHSRNATGDHMETDGRLAVIELRTPMACQDVARMH